MSERIVVTGMGTLNALGLSVAETWEKALEGVSGVAPITMFDASEYLIKYAAEVKGFNPDQYMPAKEVRRMDRFEQFGMAAAKEAFESSGLEVTEQNADRIGVIVSSAIGGLISMQDAAFTILQQGNRRVSPFTIPMMMPNGAAGLISITYGTRGPSHSIASACASGTDAIGVAWMMLQAGMIDAALAGAAETTVCPVGVASFDRMGAMSRQESGVPKPFDKDRDGLVMGEGAAVLVLERESDAKARGAHIYAEIAGYGTTSDSFHITAPAEDGSGGARAMRQAMASGRINPQDVDYINAHGTATPLNDQMETRAIKAAMGEHAYKLAVSSTKSMTGHMMGATGALETIFCVKAVSEGVIPPTINYQTPDPECDLQITPNQARQMKVDVALNNSFGFGGHNAVIAVRRYRG